MASKDSHVAEEQKLYQLVADATRDKAARVKQEQDKVDKAAEEWARPRFAAICVYMAELLSKTYSTNEKHSFRFNWYATTAAANSVTDAKKGIFYGDPTTAEISALQTKILKLKGVCSVIYKMPGFGEQGVRCYSDTGTRRLEVVHRCMDSDEKQQKPMFAHLD